jgi:O-acetylserine/cysteine efflux transporter
MPLRDFGLLALICFVWGLNVVLTRWVFETYSVPPLFYAGLRFGLIALVLVAFLRPLPKQWGMLSAVALCTGFAHFALLFLGLANAQASAVAVVGQLGVPFTTLLSIWFLNEKVRWRRALGIALALGGVGVILIDPGRLDAGVFAEPGLLFVVASAFIGAVGAILMKRMQPLPAWQMQAWVGLVSVVPLLGLSAALEPAPWGALAAADAGFWAATAFGVLAVSVFGHSAFYTLLKRHDASLLAPLTLMTPLWGVALGALALGEALSGRLLIGGALALVGVGIVAARMDGRWPRWPSGRQLP